MINLSLKSCCDDDQTAFIIFFSVYVLLILVLWRTWVLAPFKLITVFLHELSHAIACKLTCGKVIGMEVNLDEGGVTKTTGGWMWVILPAGYLGSSFWGMVFVLSSTKTWSAAAACAFLAISLFVVLFKAKNNTLRILCVCFLLLLLLFFFLQFRTSAKQFHLLRYSILFLGVMNGLFSIYDIYDDTISRRVNTSDAEMFAKNCDGCCCCCNGMAWGIIWGFLSLIFLILAVYLSLLILE